MIRSHQDRSSVPEVCPAGISSGSEGALVPTPISQQDCFEVYEDSLAVKRSGGSSPVPPDRSDTEIDAFSSKSRSRLRKKAVNASPALISQFLLTYHNEWPTDGRISKSHLNAWLTALRRIIPGVGYLWILEFQQKNGRFAPHYHVFLTVPPDRQLQSKLAAAWIRITGEVNQQRIDFNNHVNNWIDWVMGNGKYLCKYLDKEAQKCLPEGSSNFGRFWGNSRGLAPVQEKIPLDEVEERCSVVDRETGEIYGGTKTVIRWLGRLAEKQTNGYSRFRTRAQNFSYSMFGGAKAYRQIERYFKQLKDGG